MEMNNLFSGVFENLTVLLTGHTGFKGSWLSIWLKEMGANVIGYSLQEPPSFPSNFEISGVNRYLIDIRGDIRDYETISQIIHKYRPALVIHFAAQTTVLPSYQQPKISFDTNVGGTINVLEAVRASGSVKALVVCATDKVYENKEWIWGYRENDELGGFDPYSTSKAMAELAVNSYRKSFFNDQNFPSNTGVAVGSVRAGNVIGGGDFTEYGLLADCMRALMQGRPIMLRNPLSVRPWQYVLEPLSGYLWLAVKLLREGEPFAEAWNFGPLQHKGIVTQSVVEQIIGLWGSGEWFQEQADLSQKDPRPHEASYLHLNWEKAASRLNWRPVFKIEEALSDTVRWYRAYQQNQDMHEVCVNCIRDYVQRARTRGLDWSLT